MRHGGANSLSLAVFLLLSLVGCSPSESTSRAPTSRDGKVSDLPDFALIRDLADRATSADSLSSLSFNVPMPHLTEKELELHLLGDVEFNRQFNTEGGVGPAFNASSCIICHARDGRGALPVIKPGTTKVRLGAAESLLLRISLENELGPKIVPGFTEQLFHRGVYSLRPDSPGTGQADVDMSFSTSSFTYPDGRIVELRKPVFTLSKAYDKIDGQPSALEHPDLRVSPRMGPPMIGLGLIEAIDDRDIHALADPDDENGDGISGRVHVVNGRVGRFGWKAAVPSLRKQVAAALSNDMGLRNSLFPKENITGTQLFESFLQRLGDLPKNLIGSLLEFADGEKLELQDSSLDALEFYVQTLAVPARRDVEVPAVLRGARIFESINCTGCHTPRFRTSDTAAVASLRGLTIYPFSDGLLHDMGDELSDNRTDLEASGHEWKTRPLWGLGLTQTVNPRAGLLHDGRARTIEEAILYHGGEAAKSREKFSHLPASERQDLILFLRSL